MIKLSEKQLEARDLIDESLRPVRLVGGPGVGKTTVINNLRCRPRKVAPTNKAASLINGETVHSLLGLTVKEVGGKTVTVPTRKTPKTPLKEKVVFDEASCLPKDILEDFVIPLVPKAILVGDDAQLNPVDESIIPFIGLDMPEVKLDHVHRFDGELLEVSYDIRKCVFDDTAQFAIPKSWESKEFLDLGPDDVIIAWRNETVNYYNRQIKMHRYDTLDWVEGEHVRVGSFYERNRLATESEYIITKVGRNFSTHYEAWNITLDNGCTVPVLHDNDRAMYNEQLKTFADQQNWPAFWALKKAFCDLRPSFAITAHKSQGSTYDNVFVDYADIFANPKWNEAVRAAYVATTRARFGVRNLIK